MKFSRLASYFQKLESTTSRNKMTAILAEVFQQASPKEIDKICYLALGNLGPKFKAIEFNLAQKMMIRALAQVSRQDEVSIAEQFKKLGDLGNTVYKLKTQNLNLKTTSQNLKLNIDEVYQRLQGIAQEMGEGSVERKIKKMSQLLVELDPLSAKYVVRITLGLLRLGFSDMTILDALSWMLTGDKSRRLDIESAYNVRADVGQIATFIKFKGLKSLKSLKAQLGTPIIPALCQRLPNAEEMVEKMGQVAVEPKYDGQRLQIHLKSGKINIFTRNLDNVTQMFPDIAQAVRQEVKAKSAILDGEAVGIDPRTGRLLPFQETIKRKRKHQIQLMVATIPLSFFCFDLLFYNGKSLLAVPFSQRRRLLEKILSPQNQTIKLTPQIMADNSAAIRSYHEKQIKNGLEGAVLKKWQAAYDPGRRGYTWVKFKSEKKGKRGGGLADTLDCLVMGYYFGKGKRTGFGLGAFLAGIRYQDQFLTVSKVGTGLSDEQWRELKVSSEKSAVNRQPKEYLVDKNLVPDVWLRPKLVVEIEADNITCSPLHSAGYALRFPRLIRFRDDKNPEQTTSLQEVKKLYRIQ